MKTHRILPLILAAAFLGVPDASANWPVQRKMNPLHMAVVFTKFKGEAPGDTLAPAWADRIFDGEPGSVPHFFEKVSFGTYKITGEYLPKRYELPEPAEAYVPRKRDKFTRDVLDLLNADPDVDFSRFDTDGPDGIYGSADDDHYVDYMVIMPMSRPYDFLQEYATGIWTLGLIDTYITNNKSSDGFWIKADKWSGCIAVANSLNEAVGTIVAEIAHAYGAGALDLMDKEWKRDDPSTDSAGVGYWDFLGRGALGWNEQNGPMGPGAFNRMRMDSVGPNNTNLVDLWGFQQDKSIKDVGQRDGVVYRIPISEVEYFLIEFRRSAGLYYDRYIPQDGILIWHVLYGETNNNEHKKLCDLECPDGRYLDAGYPIGKKPDPINGGDNLDFWAHDDLYAAVYAGNQGDAFDVYDGVRYNRFGTDTNPNSFSKVTNQKTGIEIFNIRAMGDSMLFDCIIPPFHNWFEEKYPFIGVAFHRFAETGADVTAKPGETDLYLVRAGANRKPAMMVTVRNGELKAESLAMLEDYEIYSLVNRRLITTEEHLRDSIVKRRNVPLDEFARVIERFGLKLSDLAEYGEPTLVQKVTRYSSGDFRPVAIKLYQNFPNPFNSTTTITYALPSESEVRLEVYNTLGQKVMVIDEGRKSTGLHAVRFDAGDLASGVYLYRLRGDMVSETKKLTLIR